MLGAFKEIMVLFSALVGEYSIANAMSLYARSKKRIDYIPK